MMLPACRAAAGGGSGLVRAFSLIELLVVIAIVAVLAVLASMSISGMASSSAMAEASAQVRGAIESARQSAVATGTYHYVGLHSTDDPPAFDIASFRSLNGPLPVGTHALANSTDVEWVGKRISVEGAAIRDMPTDLLRFEALPTDQQLDDAGKTSDTNLKFSVTSGGQTILFDRVIEITPRGQIRVPGGAAASAIKVFLSPRSSAPSLVWVHADTGFVEEFR